MSMTRSRVEADGRTTYPYERRELRETKPSFLTTEFWAMIAGVVAVFAIYNLADDASFNLWRAMVVGTGIAMAYIISRGIAKAGSHDDKSDVRDPETWRSDPRRDGR
jgi:hypothetical protein